MVPRAEWLLKNIRYYPRLEPFLQSMQNGETPFGHMPSCTIEKGMELSLQKLFSRYEIEGKDLEAILLRDAKRVIYHYEKLLDAKLAKPIYLIKDYLDQNYANPKLNNALLMKVFHITEKTLIETFKAKFCATPYNYLISLRMKEARKILEKKEKTPSQVSTLVGYENFRSFSIQFKKFYRISPSECLRPYSYSS